MLLHDDHTFRFAYKRTDTATIQMMDPDKTEVSPGAQQLLVPQSRFQCDVMCELLMTPQVVNSHESIPSKKSTILT